MFGPKKRIHRNSLYISNYRVSEKRSISVASVHCVCTMYAFMGVCIYVHVYPHAHVCKWRPEVHPWCHSSGNENVSHTGTWGLPFRLDWLTAHRAPGTHRSAPPHWWDYKHVSTHLPFLVGYWRCSSVPHAFLISTLLTELPLLPMILSLTWVG